MDKLEQYFEEFSALVGKYKKITIITHINPDADTIGTGLGIYGYFKNLKKQVEIVNFSSELPGHLDFLKYFSKIKNKIDYDDSLMISCDCGSIDRLGFDVGGRDIINIDHHVSNSMFGILNIVDESAVSSSEVAFGMLGDKHLSVDEMTAFYVALISDTQNFSISTVREETFLMASKMLAKGVDLTEVNNNMNHRKSLASIRILGKALSGLELFADGTLAVITISSSDMLATGAKNKDIDGIIDYAISLVNVKTAILLQELEGKVKVSLRSKGSDVSRLAMSYGGGGHMKASGFEYIGKTIDKLSDELRDKILVGGML